MIVFIDPYEASAMGNKIPLDKKKMAAMLAAAATILTILAALKVYISNEQQKIFNFAGCLAANKVILTGSLSDSGEFWWVLDTKAQKQKFSRYSFGPDSDDDPWKQLIYADGYDPNNSRNCEKIGANSANCAFFVGGLFTGSNCQEFTELDNEEHNPIDCVLKYGPTWVFHDNTNNLYTLHMDTNNKGVFESGGAWELEQISKWAKKHNIDCQYP